MRAVPESTALPSAAGVRDEELLARAQAGEHDAVGVLFDRYACLVFGIGFRILRDHGEAEDLVQDVFLRLIEKEFAQRAAVLRSPTAPSAPLLGPAPALLVPEGPRGATL